ncbi:MAG: NYN domain-containing protein [Selenomonadaceae bacterium]|jgi:predicted nuclease of predicted toxin-antitoxin system
MMKKISKERAVAVLYDIENAPFEMLDYALGKARKYLPCKLLAASDWDLRPDKKRWNRLMRRKGYTFLQVERKVDGKNSLDYALFDMALQLKNKGVRHFIIITTDSDFAQIAKTLKKDEPAVHIVGIGTEQANQLLRDAYDEFVCYPPIQPSAVEPPVTEEKIMVKNDEAEKILPLTVPAAEPAGNLQVTIPKSLHRELCQRARAENVSFDQLVTYILTRGLER